MESYNILTPQILEQLDSFVGDALLRQETILTLREKLSYRKSQDNRRCGICMSYRKDNVCIILNNRTPEDCIVNPYAVCSCFEFPNE